MSFYSNGGLTIDRTLTLKNYRLFFTDPIYARILLKSLWIFLALILMMTRYLGSSGEAEKAKR